MPKYVVKTQNDRNLVIEADRLNVGSSEEYLFENKTEDGRINIVASVNRHAVIAVIEDKADLCDYYYSDHELDDRFHGDSGHSNLARSAADPVETDDVCTDCRNEELFESQEFFDAVFDLIQLWHEGPDELEEDEAAAPVVEHWSNGEEEWWGFQTPEGFVNFSSEKSADYGLKIHDEHRIWVYLDLTGYTKKEIQ